MYPVQAHLCLLCAHAILGHPIGATGLGQCAELIWQVPSVYI